MARILIVESSTLLRSALAQWLERRGHCVARARDAGSAREEATILTPDLLITESADRDDGEGNLLSRDLRRDVPRLRWVVTTTRPSAAIEEHARRLGADAVLLKPFGLDELDWAVECALVRAECDTSV